MAAGATYTPIATTTLGTAATSITFNSFSGYTDLVIVLSAIADNTNTRYAYLQFNSDTGTNYSNTYLSGNGSSAESGRDTSATYIKGNQFGAAFSSTTNPMTDIINIQNYSNSTTYKTVLLRSNAAGSGVTALVGLWRNTAAITSITLGVSSDKYGIGTTATLYGIVAA